MPATGQVPLLTKRRQEALKDNFWLMPGAIKIKQATGGAGRREACLPAPPVSLRNTYMAVLSN